MDHDSILNLLFPEGSEEPKEDELGKKDLIIYLRMWQFLYIKSLLMLKNLKKQELLSFYLKKI